MILTCERSGETIALRKGQEIVLSLRENPTTGYRWAVAADGLNILDDAYAADAADATASVGGGGVRTLRLVATRAGDDVVTATLQRNWEDPAKAVDRCEFRFRVS